MTGIEMERVDMVRIAHRRRLPAAVAAVLAVTTAATGCAPVALYDGPRDAALRSVTVEDAPGDVQGARLDGGPPHGGIDLRAASLRDGGDVLLVEMTVGDHGRGRTRPQA